jgi:hypothetical protein
LAAVSFPIIGVDFLRHFGLMVDPAANTLVDKRSAESFATVSALTAAASADSGPPPAAQLTGPQSPVLSHRSSVTGPQSPVTSHRSSVTGLQRAAAADDGGRLSSGQLQAAVGRLPGGSECFQDATPPPLWRC